MKHLHQILLNSENSNAISSSGSHASTMPVLAAVSAAAESTHLNQFLLQMFAWIQHPETLSYPQLPFQTLTFIENMDVTVT